MVIRWPRKRPLAIRDEIAAEFAPVWLSFEDRLQEIVKSEEELKKEADDIKDIASSIVRTLGTADDSAQILKDIAPVLHEIPALLKVVLPILKAIETQFETISKAQVDLSEEIKSLHTFIESISEQLSGRYC